MEPGGSLSRILREQNSEEFAAAKHAILKTVLLAALEEVMGTLTLTDDFADLVLERITAHEDTISKLVDKVRERFIETIALRTLAELADEEQTVERAAKLIDPEHPSLDNATESLTQHLVSDVAQRSVDQLADPNVLTQQAKTLLMSEQDAILGAVDLLKDRLLQNIVQESMTRIREEIGAVVPTPKPTPPPPAESPSSEPFSTTARTLKMRLPRLPDDPEPSTPSWHSDYAS